MGPAMNTRETGTVDRLRRLIAKMNIDVLMAH